jgi:hypothetical protein
MQDLAVRFMVFCLWSALLAFCAGLALWSLRFFYENLTGLAGG